MTCQHEPILLFDGPAKEADARATILYCISPWTCLDWVICRKCGETGYWGGYGFKRRVEWGYGGDQVLLAAEKHNRMMCSDSNRGLAL